MVLDCRKAGPARTPRTVASFVTDQHNHAGATMLLPRQAAIRKIHQLLRLPTTAEGEDVTITIRRSKRAKGTRPQQEALGRPADDSSM